MERAGVSEKTFKSFERIDAMSMDMRAQACVTAGVSHPAKIRHLVHEIWAGARQSSQRQPTLGSLDWILIQAGAQISAKTLVRVLRDDNHYIVPLDPTRHMVEASMAEVSNFSVKCSKMDKHRRRLRAAIVAGVRHLWPDIV